jgi:hypothetical protein
MSKIAFKASAYPLLPEQGKPRKPYRLLFFLGCFLYKITFYG